MSLQGSLSIERMCQLVPVSRRGFYRSLKEFDLNAPPLRPDKEVFMSGARNAVCAAWPLPGAS
jgi:hypothetical protein